MLISTDAGDDVTGEMIGAASVVTEAVVGELEDAGFDGVDGGVTIKSPRLEASVASVASVVLSSSSDESSSPGTGVDHSTNSNGVGSVGSSSIVVTHWSLSSSSSVVVLGLVVVTWEVVEDASWFVVDDTVDVACSPLIGGLSEVGTSG